MTELIIPAFIAGLITFLAPCTLPLVPGFIGFISGVSKDELANDDTRKKARAKIMLNGILYIIGFTLVFLIMGTIFTAASIQLAELRTWLIRIGGILIILFGIHMLHIFKLPFFSFLDKQKQLPVAKYIKPGHPLSSFLFGASFAVGWTPCVGPILGSILLLASQTATVAQGTFLLFIFSLGLAIPFFLVTLSIGQATRFIKKIQKYLFVVEIIGGIFLIILGVVLLTNNLSRWISFMFDLFGGLHYDSILELL